MERQIILGPPGTGKTTTLLDILEDELRTTVPSKIAYVSFTRKSTNEALDRAMLKFGFKKGDLPFFRTIHSMCYRVNLLTPSDVMQYKDWEELGDMLSVKFTSRTPEDGVPGEKEEGDVMRHLYQYSRAVMRPVEEVWDDHIMSEMIISPHRVRQFLKTLESYKMDTGLVDFSDMLERALEQPPLSVDVAIVDEAQDLTTIQWQVIEHLFQNVKKLYIAGDDDQSIYVWSGADIKHFLSLKGDVRVLHQSYRIPVEVQKEANAIIGRVTERFPKQWKPREEKGAVIYYPSPEQVELNNGKTWYLLARNNYMLQRWEQVAWEQGVLFSTNRKASSMEPGHYTAIAAYEKLRKGGSITTASLNEIYNHSLQEQIDKGRSTWRIQDTNINPNIPWYSYFKGIGDDTLQYYRDVLNNGQKLSEEPKVHISTIHGVKGGEADCVAMLTDVSWRCKNAAKTLPDSEHRAFFVGVTRARNELHIITPQTPVYYEM